VRTEQPGPTYTVRLARGRGMCVGGSVEPARRGRGCVGRWRVEMNSIDYEIANPDPAGTITSVSSLDVPSELDAIGSPARSATAARSRSAIWLGRPAWNTDIREPTVVPPIPVRGHARRAGVIACRLARDTSRHRERPPGRTRGAGFLFAWTVRCDNRQLTCSVEPGAPTRATDARGELDNSPLGAQT
jgi:hypothetical protein